MLLLVQCHRFIGSFALPAFFEKQVLWIMIIYEDLHRPPMFLSLYKESGIAAQNRFAGRGAMLLAREVRFFSAWELLYKRLRFQAGDNKVVVFDSGTSPEYLNWLCSRYPGKRIILFFWNPVWEFRFDQLNPRVEIWTYSLRDSAKYGIRLNTQFYFDSLADEANRFSSALHHEHPKVLFVGREKGRANALNDLSLSLRAAGADVELFMIHRPPHYMGPAHLAEKTVSYRAVVEMLKPADIILDYFSDPQAGLSLRAMESLFWQKKLITNNASILNADFYHPNNIYVLGKDTRRLEDFFYCAPQPVEQRVRDRYRLSNWLNRFDEVDKCSTR